MSQEQASSDVFGKVDSGKFMQCESDPAWSSVVSNSDGRGGWARILRSGGDDVPEGVCRRVHLCASNPCNARWVASKYGVMGPPIHLQPATSEEVSWPPAGALYIQEVSRHQPHVTRSCGHSPRSPQLRGPMQQTQVTRSSAEYWPWPEKSEHPGHMWVIVSLYCWGLQENASRVCGRETTE